MAVRSVKLNHLENVMEIINCDINELRLENNSFDAVVTNPPYKKLETGIVAKNNKQMISRFETSANLDDWIKISSGLLNNKGSFYMVYRTDRMSELFCILKKYKLEVKKIRFVYSFLNKQSKMVLLKAVKYGGVFLKVESPLIIYNDDGSYTDEILKIYNKL